MERRRLIGPVRPRAERNPWNIAGGKPVYKEATSIPRPSMSHDTQAPEYKEADRRVPPRPVVSPSIVPTPRARQGVTGHNVRYVLGFGLTAIIIAFIIVYLLYFG
jgi:hypothetical protein